MTLDTERIDRLEGISDKLTSAVLTIYEKLDRMEKRLGARPRNTVGECLGV